MSPEDKSSSARKKLRLLLLDANVVLELHRLGLWARVLDNCEVLLAATVVGESKHYETEDGKGHKIDLSPDVAAQRIRVVTVELASLSTFRGRFRPTFLERLDPGELEALAYLVEVDRACRISSADKIVWRTLGALNLSDRGVSLEEILQQIGLGRALFPEYGKAYREQWTQRGFSEGLQGDALRR